MKNTPRPQTSALSILARGAALAAALLAVPAAHAQNNYATPYTFSTLAGTPLVIGSVDGTGTAATFYVPTGVAVDSGGNIYVADTDSNVIRKIAPGGVVTTLAGVSSLVGGSTDGTGSGARFDGPSGVAVDSSGNLYVTDSGNDTIRKVTPAGVVTTLAGTAGNAGNSDGTGPAASFNDPTGIGIDSGGNLYVADTINNTIRKITPAGVVSTFIGDAGVPGSINGTGTVARFKSPSAVAVDGSGNVYVADTGNYLVRMSTSAGVVTTLAGTAGSRGTADGSGSAARFYEPAGITVDGSGNVYVADTGNDTIRKITSGGSVTTIAGAVALPGSVDGTGTAAQFFAPGGLAVDSGGNVYVADKGNDQIREMTPAGVVTTVAGAVGGSGENDGTGPAAEFNEPSGVAVDGSGNVYVTDQLNDTIRKITPAGVVTTLAGTPGQIGSADGTGPAASFFFPFDIAVDGSGNLYVTDSGNDTIRKITPAGVVTTLAGTAGKPGDTNGTGTGASFTDPVGIAVDSSGNVYVSEQQSDDIRMITPAGVVTTLAGTPGVIGSANGTGPAAQFALPAGLAVDGSGNVYVADYGNGTVRKIAPGGVVTTFAGTAGNEGNADGTGPNAQFNGLIGVAVDGSGNVYVVDQANELIREVSPAGVVTTLAGTEKKKGSTNGTGAAALFNTPYFDAVDSSGNLYVSDLGNDVIRKGFFSGAPEILTQPSNEYASAGGSATFTVTASGSGTLSYQWNFNGNPIAGATASSYTVSNVQASNSGLYTVTVTNSLGTVTSGAGNLYLNSGSSGARLINISTRAQVGTGGSVLIPGFVIGGSGVETLLIRADGPSLTAFGVPGALAQPSLTVTNSQQVVVATNTGWSNSLNPSQLTSVAAQVGAFAFAANSADSAVVVSLPPGAYTAQISGVGNTTGVALAEVYEVSSTGSTRLINIATRAQVGTGGSIMIAGFVISGGGNEQLLIRGDGPSLTTFGVPNALAATSLTILSSGGTVVASNTGWTTNANAAQITSVGASVGAFALPAGSADSAVIVNLPEGDYTAQVAGLNATTGVGLAEVYEVP
jgi:sugar lactone lactonase YvrE